MKISVTVTKGDVMQFNFYHNNRSVIQKLIYLVSIVLAISMLIGFVNERDMEKLLFALIFIFIIGLSKIVNKIFVKIKFKKKDIEDTRNEYSFYDEYFEVDDLNDKYYYKKVKFKNDKEAIYLYIDRKKAFIIPKRDVDVNKIKELFKNNEKVI